MRYHIGMTLSIREPTFREECYSSALELSKRTTGLLALVELKFQLLKESENEWNLAASLESWSQGGQPPTVFLYSAAISGSFALGGVMGACSHIARSIFPR